MSKPTFEFDLHISTGRANEAFKRIKKRFVALERATKFVRTIKRLRERKRKNLL